MFGIQDTTTSLFGGIDLTVEHRQPTRQGAVEGVFFVLGDLRNKVSLGFKIWPGGAQGV